MKALKLPKRIVGFVFYLSLFVGIRLVNYLIYWLIVIAFTSLFLAKSYLPFQTHVIPPFIKTATSLDEIQFSFDLELKELTRISFADIFLANKSHKLHVQDFNIFIDFPKWYQTEQNFLYFHLGDLRLVEMAQLRAKKGPESDNLYQTFTKLFAGLSATLEDQRLGYFVQILDLSKIRSQNMVFYQGEKKIQEIRMQSFTSNESSIKSQGLFFDYTHDVQLNFLSQLSPKQGSVDFKIALQNYQKTKSPVSEFLALHEQLSLKLNILPQARLKASLELVPDNAEIDTILLEAQLEELAQAIDSHLSLSILSQASSTSQVQADLSLDNQQLALATEVAAIQIPQITELIDFYGQLIHSADFQRLSQQLKSAAPRGKIENLQLEAELQKNGPSYSFEDLSYQAELKDVSFESVDKAPRVAGLSGLIKGDVDEVAFDLNTAALSFSLPSLYEQAFEFGPSQAHLHLGFEDAVEVRLKDIDFAYLGQNLTGDLYLDLLRETSSKDFFSLDLALENVDFDRLLRDFYPKVAPQDIQKQLIESLNADLKSLNFALRIKDSHGKNSPQNKVQPYFSLKTQAHKADYRLIYQDLDLSFEAKTIDFSIDSNKVQATSPEISVPKFNTNITDVGFEKNLKDSSPSKLTFQFSDSATNLKKIITLFPQLKEASTRLENLPLEANLQADVALSIPATKTQELDFSLGLDIEAINLLSLHPQLAKASKNLALEDSLYAQLFITPDGLEIEQVDVQNLLVPLYFDKQNPASKNQRNLLDRRANYQFFAELLSNVSQGEFVLEDYIQGGWDYSIGLAHTSAFNYSLILQATPSLESKHQNILTHRPQDLQEFSLHLDFSTAFAADNRVLQKIDFIAPEQHLHFSKSASENLSELVLEGKPISRDYVSGALSVETLNIGVFMQFLDALSSLVPAKNQQNQQNNQGDQDQDSQNAPQDIHQLPFAHLKLAANRVFVPGGLQAFSQDIELVFQDDLQIETAGDLLDASLVYDFENNLLEGIVEKLTIATTSQATVRKNSVGFQTSGKNWPNLKVQLENITYNSEDLGTASLAATNSIDQDNKYTALIQHIYPMGIKSQIDFAWDELRQSSNAEIQAVGNALESKAFSIEKIRAEASLSWLGVPWANANIPPSGEFNLDVQNFTLNQEVKGFQDLRILEILNIINVYRWESFFSFSQEHKFSGYEEIALKLLLQSGWIEIDSLTAQNPSHTLSADSGYINTLTQDVDLLFNIQLRLGEIGATYMLINAILALNPIFLLWGAGAQWSLEGLSNFNLDIKGTYPKDLEYSVWK